MAVEILIYDSFYRYSAERIVAQLSELKGDFSVRLNSPGGAVDHAYAILVKMSEIKGGDTITIDGQAASMGAFILPFFKNRIGYDTNSIMLHKAAYSSYYEPTAEEQERLLALNNLIKSKMEQAGISSELIEKVFRPDIREDVHLTPQQALDYGLITELRTLEVAEKKKLQALKAKHDAEIAAYYEPTSSSTIDNSTTQKMNLAELKAKHPDTFKEAVAEGVAQERKRVGQLVTFVKKSENSAAGRAIKAIRDGEDLSDISGEMMQLAIAEARTSEMESENVEDLGDDSQSSTPESTANASIGDSGQEAFNASLERIVSKMKGGTK